MQRMIGLAAVASVVSITAGGGDRIAAVAVRPAAAAALAPQGPLDVGSLLAAAHGAPPMICALALHAVGNGRWGRWADAPATPLGAVGVDDNRDERERQLSAADEDRLLTGLASDDACVRELSVRLLGDHGNTRIANALITRLTSSDASLRTIAAAGLGLVSLETGVDGLIAALRDGTPAVRANSAWALGRIENGRALSPLVQLFRDNDTTVREAAVAAVGQLDSTSVTAALTRVLQQDPAASVRLVAAWALGTLEAHDAAATLATTLGHDTDPRVREMSAWALGNIEAKGSAAALITALQHDEDDKVRETAAWAIGQGENRSAMDALGTAAGGDHSAGVRGTAAWAIGQLADDGVERQPDCFACSPTTTTTPGSRQPGRSGSSRTPLHSRRFARRSTQRRTPRCGEPSCVRSSNVGDTRSRR